LNPETSRTDCTEESVWLNDAVDSLHFRGITSFYSRQKTQTLAYKESVQ